ncbi:cAMP-dependent protein kinase catalytic subunit PRKX-like isoform X1 [Neoarius graeffei]|uniref:cAMP-dependent protein kinase catalytic subunit PRKX-like isoform X1 n=1 Tax=Neoarius graeffei TaxID=443677 RepID=UPI00298CD98C|nr:cAMP-dependent protein kinase catalytic subunit PRKX-like isoform X1 [Neoarius graeffei]
MTAARSTSERGGRGAGDGDGEGSARASQEQAGAAHLSLGVLESVATVGTGTFGRVVLVQDRKTKGYFALKSMKIVDLIRLKQQQHVHNEKEVLMEVNHPFIVKLFWTWHDDRCLFMLMEFVPGGELFSYLRSRGKFSNDTGLFFAAEIVCALEYLHSKDIVYRDLKPENILLDREGHVKLTDFGFAKKVVDRTCTLCGTPEYLAPEIIQGKGHGLAVDWWALGILIFEMLSGYPPFFDDNPFGIYQKVLSAKLNIPRQLDFYVHIILETDCQETVTVPDNVHYSTVGSIARLRDLIKKLLVVDKTKRLGNLRGGAEDVKSHKWFRSVDWEVVPQRKLKPIIIPEVAHEGDPSNFEAYPEEKRKKEPAISPKDLEIFKNF